MNIGPIKRKSCIGFVNQVMHSEPYHLHLIPFESALWQERIKFRDLLRSDKSIFEQYAKLKQELAVLHKEDREAYTQKKWPFIQQALLSNNPQKPYKSRRYM